MLHISVLHPVNTAGWCRFVSVRYLFVCLFVCLEASFASWCTLTCPSYSDFWFQGRTTISGHNKISKISWAQYRLLPQFQAPDATLTVHSLVPACNFKSPLKPPHPQSSCSLSCAREVENQILWMWVTPIDRLSVTPNSVRKALIVSVQKESISMPLSPASAVAAVLQSCRTNLAFITLWCLTTTIVVAPHR